MSVSSFLLGSFPELGAPSSMFPKQQDPCVDCEESEYSWLCRVSYVFPWTSNYPYDEVLGFQNLLFKALSHKACVPGAGMMKYQLLPFLMETPRSARCAGGLE